jgi:transcriptional regulator with XRE-family HTH domain
MQSDAKRIGINLKLIRVARGLTQQQLGDEVGMHREYVAALEGGRFRDFGLIKASRLAKALGVPLDVLVDESPRLPRRRPVETTEQAAARRAG